MSGPTFTISVLALNNLELTKRCLASVLRNSSDFELILTNNGSTDGIPAFFEEVAKEFPCVRVVHNATNLGYQEPNRVALEMATGEYLVLLNNDCEVPPNWLTELKKPFDQFPSACISAPRECGSALQPSFHGYRSPRVFEYCEFSTACLKVSLFRRHGLWIPGIKHSYADDSSTCLRMRELGYTLHLVPIHVVHYGGRTSQFVPNIRQIQEENHAVCRARFAHYLKVRKMDYPVIVRRMAANGDVLLVTPILRALKGRHPLSKIYVETTCPQVLLRHPYATVAAPRSLRLPDALIYNLDGAYESKTNQHIVLAYAERCGLSAVDDRTELFISPPDEERAAKLMPGEKWVAMHVGPSTWRSKEWPIERFLEVVLHLQADGYRVVLVGSPGKPLQSDLDERGRTTALEMGALIKRACLFIGIDSLPIHVAQAVGTPVVGLFGITDPKYILTSGSPSIGVCGTTPSFGLRHRVVNHTVVDDAGAAMNSISVDMVLSAVDQMLLPKEAGQPA